MRARAAPSTRVPSGSAHKQGPTRSSESDSFSYNPRYLEDWSIPAELKDVLPSHLATEIEGWQAAGAAVITTLHRLERFDNEALFRGWPIKKTEHLSRTPSMKATASGAQSPQSVRSTSASLGPCEPLQPVRQPRVAVCPSNVSTRSPFSEAVAESPPLPSDDARSQLSDSQGHPARSSIDPMQLNERLLPLTENKASDFNTSSPPVTASSSPLSPNVLPQFDEASWDVFVNQYSAELENLRHHEIVRFRHVRRGIDKMCFEMEVGQPALDASAWYTSFNKWWVNMGVNQEEVEKQIRLFQVPDLEQVRLERVAQGLVI